MLRTKYVTLYLPFCQLSVIAHILTNQVFRCWADGGFKISKKRLQTVFSHLAFFPTRPYHPFSPSSLHVCVRHDETLVLVTLREKTGCQQTRLYGELEKCNVTCNQFMLLILLPLIFSDLQLFYDLFCFRCQCSVGQASNECETC